MEGPHKEHGTFAVEPVGIKADRGLACQFLDEQQECHISEEQ